MNNTVTIKGTKSGIILVLEPEMDFSRLKDEISKKFEEAASFLGNNNMGLIIRGRKLSGEEENEVLSIINEKTDLKIVCLIDEESDTEKRFEAAAASHSQPQADEQADDNSEEVVRTDSNNALIYSGSLRSGQDVSCEQSIVILGDVKPGASVVSYGSIFILGELRGNAFAGAGGDRSAVIMALRLNPLQVRIADAIAISPDAEKGPKLRIKRKKLTDSENVPEVAYIDGEHIVKTTYGPNFLRQFNIK